MVVKKKYICALFSAIFLLGLVGCTEDSKKEKIEIGVCQLTQHDALDKSYSGFRDALKEKGYIDGENINIDLKNAQGDFTTAQTICKQFTDDKKDLIFAIATPAAQAAYNSTKDIPIIFTAVTDPVEAKIVNSIENSGNNVTGVSDMVPIDKQLDLANKLVEDIKVIGYIYNTSEANSEVQLKGLKSEANKRGIRVKEVGVTNVNEINQNLNSAIKDIDVLYTPTDNTVASSYSLIGEICLENKVPVIAAEEAMVDCGGLVTLGIDYYNLGKQTGEKAVSLIEGKKPSEIKITTLDKLSVKINKNTANALNIEIPKDIEKEAELITGGEKVGATN